MKYIFKILVIFPLLIIFISSFSQNRNEEKRYIKEIRSIFNDATNQNLNWLYFLNFDNTITLPSYFTSYKDFSNNQKKIKSKEDWYTFNPSNAINYNLDSSDFEEINKIILKDTSRLFIQVKWFKKNKIRILSNADSNEMEYSTEFLKPIFFRNYTKCFIAILDDSSMDSFFLKKINGKWVFDNFSQRYIND
jgi:hypothetical protein